MKPREVKRRLAELGIRQIDLAKKWKLRAATVSQFLDAKFASKRLDKKLAQILGVTVEELRGEKPKQPSVPPEQVAL